MDKITVGQLGKWKAETIRECPKCGGKLHELGQEHNSEQRIDHLVCGTCDSYYDVVYRYVVDYIEEVDGVKSMFCLPL